MFLSRLWICRPPPCSEPHRLQTCATVLFLIDSSTMAPLELGELSPPGITAITVYHFSHEKRVARSVVTSASLAFVIETRHEKRTRRLDHWGWTFGHWHGCHPGRVWSSSAGAGAGEVSALPRRGVADPFHVWSTGAPGADPEDEEVAFHEKV